MSARRGWCPTLHRPMPSGDGSLVRLRPRFATLDAAALASLDRASCRHGNGIVELTGRGNLQFRGFTEEGAARFRDAVCAVGLADPDPVVDGRRRIVAAPFAPHGLVAALEAALGAEPALDALDGKFAIRVDGGALPIRAVAADLAIGPGVIEAGALTAVADDPIAAAMGLCRALAAAGLARARDAAPGAIDAMLRALGLVPEAASGGDDATSPSVGRLAVGTGIAPRFGQCGPGELARLASLAAAAGVPALRLTPFRSFVLPGAGDATLAAASVAGFVVDPADKRLRIRACIGAPGCAAGEAPARAVAEQHLDRVPPAGILHLSGCAKGCAHPKPAARTLVGRDGKLEERAA